LKGKLRKKLGRLSKGQSKILGGPWPTNAPLESTLAAKLAAAESYSILSGCPNQILLISVGKQQKLFFFFQLQTERQTFLFNLWKNQISGGEE